MIEVKEEYRYQKEEERNREILNMLKVLIRSNCYKEDWMEGELADGNGGE